MEEDPLGPGAAGQVRYLRALVTALTAVMIAGMVAIVALLALRLPDGRVEIPAALALPEGARATAFTRGPDWFAIVTDDDRIVIYGPGGAPRQEVRIER